MILRYTCPSGVQGIEFGPHGFFGCICGHNGRCLGTAVLPAAGITAEKSAPFCFLGFSEAAILGYVAESVVAMATNAPEGFKSLIVICFALRTHKP